MKVLVDRLLEKLRVLVHLELNVLLLRRHHVRYLFVCLHLNVVDHHLNLLRTHVGPEGWLLRHRELRHGRRGNWKRLEVRGRLLVHWEAHHLALHVESFLIKLSSVELGLRFDVGWHRPQGRNDGV